MSAAAENGGSFTGFRQDKRGKRNGAPSRFSHDEERKVREQLDAAAENWNEMEPSNEVRDTARLLLRRHPLSAADSLQLAAGLVWCENKPQGAVFVCLDQRLRDAADAEGFTVIPSATEFASIAGKK